MPNPFSSLQKAISALRKGKMIVLVDDESRENEGDLVIAAEKCTPEAVNFMASQGKGLICVPLTEQRSKELNLQLMTDMNDPFGTAFTVSVDAKHGTTTGISAYDRCETIKLLADSNSRAADFVQPGHIFPLIARKGGCIQRAGHTEASVDLMKLAGLTQVAVICEIMSAKGTMARLPELQKFAKKHNLSIITIKQLIEHRLTKERLVEKVSEAKLPTEFGEFQAIGYRDKINNYEYLALVKGEVEGRKNVLVRVQSACLTGEVFHSLRCDCRRQLIGSLQTIAKEGQGVMLYITAHEGRGIGLLNKLSAYALQDQGLDTVEANEMLGFKADLRDYGFGAQILADLGLSTIRLLTNNPRKIVALDGYGLNVVDRVPIKFPETELTKKYLATKRDKLGHMI